MRVGLSGHRNFASIKDEEWVREELTQVIKDIDIEVGVTSLAIGSDQIFASLLLDSGIPHHAVIPSKRYDRCFKDDGLELYKSLLGQSSLKLILPYPKPSDEAYLEAGKKVVDMSDLMLIIWDGKAAKGIGGTGDIVKYGKSKKKKMIHLHPIEHKVYLL